MIIYKFICTFYSHIIYAIENIFLRVEKIKNRELERKGIKKLNFTFDKFILGKEKKIIKNNKYHKRFIFSEKEIYKFLEKLFDKELRNEIKKLTGFNYSIDYFGVYRNFPINSSDRNQGFYANHFHFDKPYSKNLLKIFIPFNNIKKINGPLEVIDKSESKDIKKGIKELSIAKKYYFTGNIGDLFLLKANECLHKAGIPKEGYLTELIMLQLNPSLNWKISRKIYKRQYKIEPKFTNLINLFTKYKKIK